MTPTAFPASDAVARSLFARCMTCGGEHPCRCDAAPSEFGPGLSIATQDDLRSAAPVTLARLANSCGCLESDCALCNPEAARVIREEGRCNG